MIAKPISELRAYRDDGSLLGTAVHGRDPEWMAHAWIRNSDGSITVKTAGRDTVEDARQFLLDAGAVEIQEG